MLNGFFPLARSCALQGVASLCLMASPGVVSSDGGGTAPGLGSEPWPLGFVTSGRWPTRSDLTLVLLCVASLLMPAKGGMKEEAERPHSTWSTSRMFCQLGVVLFFIFIATQPTHHYLASPLSLNIAVVDSISLKEEASVNTLAKKSLTNPQLLILSNF